MIRSIFTVGGFTALSRVLGLVRDKLIAVHLGGGGMGDVWVAAFSLPNLFRRVFGEGAFNSAFVPMYGRRLTGEGEEVADSFARKILSLVALILLIIFALLFAFMAPVVDFLNPGYSDDGRLEPAITASRITVGYLFFICLVAGLSSILNARRIFGVPAFAYALLNFVFLAALLIFVPLFDDPLHVLSWAVLIGGVAQFLLVLIAALRNGAALRPVLPRWDADTKRLAFLMLPGLMSAAVQQTNLLVSRAFASTSEGGQIALYNADRINQFPLGVVGIAASSVLLAELSRCFGEKDLTGARDKLLGGIEIALLLGLPATAAMLVIPEAIMVGIFEGGETTAAQAREMGKVLFAFALGTPAYLLTKVLQTGYFAREDTKTPMKITVVTMIVNTALCWPLFRLYGVVGCALATSIAGWLNTAILWVGLKRLGALSFTRASAFRQLRMLIIAGLMGLVVWFLTQQFSHWVDPEQTFVVRVLFLSTVSGIGCAFYFAGLLGTRTYRLGELKRLGRSR